MVLCTKMTQKTALFLQEAPYNDLQVEVRDLELKLHDMGKHHFMQAMLSDLVADFLILPILLTPQSNPLGISNKIPEQDMM